MHIKRTPKNSECNHYYQYNPLGSIALAIKLITISKHKRWVHLQDPAKR